ncbi:MAG TPA: inositol monophosphatase family protein [Chloroflexota bacterium]|nr:inositol monophosphatase family protein [Chloroflexota bacterium]
MHRDEPNRRREVAVGAALAAGRLLRQHYGRPQQVEYKGEIDPVTALDRQAETLIVTHIHAAYPDHAILAEEGGGTPGAADHRWLVDPIDGTTNYAHGYPVFGVSLAYERAGTIVLGVVYDPLREELFLAEAGGGATLNGRPLHVSTTHTLARGLLSTGFPYDRSLYPASLRRWETLLWQAQAVRRGGSAALDLCYVAAGRADGYWEQPVQPWDVAAGLLLVTEAGGQATSFAGGPPDVYSGALVASNGRIHAELLAALAAADGDAAPPLSLGDTPNP